MVIEKVIFEQAMRGWIRLVSLMAEAAKTSVSARVKHSEGWGCKSL